MKCVGLKKVSSDRRETQGGKLALLKVSEAAKHLGVKAKTLRVWLAQRRIAYVKLGYVVRISSDEIERLIRESTVEALPKPKMKSVRKSDRKK
jgi:excisionase family DNA binding protein